MWNNGQHIQKPRCSLKELASVKGPLEMEQAQIWFAKFCMANPAFAVQLLTGVELAEVQDILIRSFFVRDYSLVIAGRGFSKSYTISLFIILYAIFYPGSKIGICSGTFRQSKNIYKQIEKFINGTKGMHLRQCLKGEIGHAGEAHVMTLGTSEIIAMPLTEKIRGYRFNVIIIDELVLVPKDIIDNVIKPFLTVKNNASPEQERMRKAEDLLIEKGKLKEEDRITFPNNKIIGLSSASFKFESLYRDQFLPYKTAINDVKAEGINHCVFQLSYEAAPPWLLDEKAIKEAKRTTSMKNFDKEYRALFIDESDGYFSAIKIQEACLARDEYPKLSIKGRPGKKHILAIDPNYHSAETADFFAMCVLEIDEETQSGTVVHLYALAVGDIADRSRYLRYILTNYNIVYIIVDRGGGPKFMDDSKIFLDGKQKEITSFEPEFDTEQELRETRKRYNVEGGQILHIQYFGESGWLRRSNENLAYMIERKFIKFGSRLYDENDWKMVRNEDVDMDSLVYSASNEPITLLPALKEDFGSTQNDLLEELKKELLIIQPSATQSGDQRFDLAKSNSNDRSNPHRARKDLYSALLMASWGLKCYFDLNKEFEEEITFVRPIFIH